MSKAKRRLRDTGLTVLLLAAVGLLIWWLTEPVGMLMASAADVRDRIASTGPHGPRGRHAVLCGSDPGGALAGQFPGGLRRLSLRLRPGLRAHPARADSGHLHCLAHRPLPGAPDAGTIRLPRRTGSLGTQATPHADHSCGSSSSSSPSQDLVVYAAGLGTSRCAGCCRRYLAGRSVGIVMAIRGGQSHARLPPQFVLLQWVLFIGLAALAYR